VELGKAILVPYHPVPYNVRKVVPKKGEKNNNNNF